MKSFLEYLLSQIVDEPKELSVEEISLEENTLQYNIRSSANDVGKIIGKDGKIIAAVRQVAKILAVKQGVRIRIQIA